jgi:SAM-dependent methyltransferase
MPTNYDGIAELYGRSKQAPWRHHIELYSLLELLGDISGAAVLDLACGDGHYTRILKRLGAAQVVGVDLSGRMVELARTAERDEPLGLEYFAADARDHQFQACLDVVLAAYLLNYARSSDELLNMARAIHRGLKPGGRLVAVNNNPMQQVGSFGCSRQYGFIKSVDGEPRNGSAIRYTFNQDGDEFVIENYHLDAETHVSALREAGFSDVKWHLPRLSPIESRTRAEYWADFLRDPPIILLSCTKQESAHSQSKSQ